MIDINISKVCKSFGFDLVLNNIDITVQKGEKVGLIGTNGSGKSTILKIIAGQESIDSGSLSIRNNISIGYLSQIPEEKDIIVKDYINSAFKEIIELKEKLERYEDKLLTEDYKVITKYMNLQEKFISLGGYEYETKIQKILPVFNITEEMLNRNFNTLSGGEKTIISLIRLLLQEPDVLLLDEPTNHLDINKMIWLEKTLKNYKGTIILVSHDRYFMDNVINKVYLLTKRGIEVYHGNYSYYIKESENRLFLELKNYKDQQKQITAMKNSIKRLKEYGRLCGPSGGEIFFRRAASIEKRLENWLLNKDYKDLIYTRRNNRIFFENKMLEAIENELYYENLYRQKGIIVESDIDIKKIKSIIKYDVPYNIVNYLLQYPLANILSNCLIDNYIIQDDNQLVEKCINMDLYKILEDYSSTTLLIIH